MRSVTEKHGGSGSDGQDVMRTGKSRLGGYSSDGGERQDTKRCGGAVKARRDTV